MPQGKTPALGTSCHPDIVKRAAAEGFRFQGKSYGEIAEVLGVSKQRVCELLADSRLARKWAYLERVVFCDPEMVSWFEEWLENEDALSARPNVAGTKRRAIAAFRQARLQSANAVQSQATN